LLEGGDIEEEVGTIIINSINSTSMNITVDLNSDYLIDDIHVFAGEYDEILTNLSDKGCPSYKSDPWQFFDVVPRSNSHTFTVTF
jgi:hypothetical protein